MSTIFPVPATKPLADFATSDLGLSKSEFLKKYNHPFVLIKPHWEEGSTSSGSEWDETPSREFERFKKRFPNAAELPKDWSKISIFSLNKETPPDVPPVFTFGRSEGCDIVVKHNLISRTHLVFRKGPGKKWYVQDPGSKNGSMFNWRTMPKDQDQLLADGDIIVTAMLAKVIFFTPEGLYYYLSFGAGEGKT